MKVNSDYIEKHLARQNAIKLRALEINNFLSDVDTGYDYREYDWCGVVSEFLDIDIVYGKVILSYEDDEYPCSWTIPFELFDMTNDELREYINQEADEQNKLELSVAEKQLQRQAEEFGYRLVPIENTGE